MTQGDLLSLDRPQNSCPAGLVRIECLVPIEDGGQVPQLREAMWYLSELEKKKKES